MGCNPFADDFAPRHAAHAKAPASQDAGAFAGSYPEFTLVLERYHACGQSHVTVPNGVTQILEGAFRGHVEIESVELPETLQSIGPKAFSGCSSLREVVVPDSVFEIGRAAFSGCISLQRVQLPDGLLKVEESLFQGCSSLAVVSGAAEVGDVAANAFSGCGALGALSLLSQVDNLGTCAFAGCGLREVELPERMRAIGDEAFKSCRALTRVTLPAEIGHLGKNIFLSCGNLAELQGFEQLAASFPGAFPRALTDKMGLLRPQDERLETKEYIQRHKDEADEVRVRLSACRNAIRALRVEQDSLGVLDRACRQEVEQELSRERAKRAALKARLEALEYPTWEQLAAQKRDAAAGAARTR